VFSGACPEETVAVEAALTQWRSKAAGALIAASCVVYLPVLVLLLAGEGPPLTRPVQVVSLASYVLLLICALPRWADYRTRAWLFLTAGYALGIVANISFPQGPIARAVPVILPLQTMVLFGVRAGRIAAVAGVAIILFAPHLHDIPSLTGILTSDVPDGPLARKVVWTQGVGMSAMLITTAILFDRFHGFLMQALSRLEREVAERMSAHRTLEREMVERRRLERKVADAGDEERHRLGRDIHDGVCQQLTGALLRCEALERRVDRGEALAAADFAALSSLLQEAVDEAHAVARGLSQLDPDPGALAAALRTLAKRTQGAGIVACTFAAAGDVRVYDPTAAQHLYRIAQEALSNAFRHARARRIHVELRGVDEGLSLKVEDDGDGLSPGRREPGMGLRTMAYRANLLEGDFTVTPVPEGGTRVLCRVPCASLTRPNNRGQNAPEGNHEH
jgi:signal transduction histidine kinase